jgi:hypothetical protein
MSVVAVIMQLIFFVGIVFIIISIVRANNGPRIQGNVANVTAPREVNNYNTANATIPGIQKVNNYNGPNATIPGIQKVNDYNTPIVPTIPEDSDVVTGNFNRYQPGGPSKLLDDTFHDMFSYRSPWVASVDVERRMRDIGENPNRYYISQV